MISIFLSSTNLQEYFFWCFFCFILFLDSNSKALFLGYVKAQENDLPLPEKF